MNDDAVKHNEAVAERLDLTLNIMLGIVNVLEKMYDVRTDSVTGYQISLGDLEKGKVGE